MNLLSECKVLKSRDIALSETLLVNRGPYSQSYGFSSSHVWMWKLDHEEGGALKNWYFWTMVLENTLDSPMDCKIELVNLRGNQFWIFIGWTDAEAEPSILWPPDVKSWLTGKDTDAGKDWRQEKGTTEDEMVGWHHWLDEMDMSLRKLWRAALHGVAKSWTWLSNRTTAKK